MTVRSCTCSMVPTLKHLRDCASLLSDPDACGHKTAQARIHGVYCSSCGKGLSVGARPWYSANLEPGYGDRMRENAAARSSLEEARMERESSYDLRGIYLGDGITDLTVMQLQRLANACIAEIMVRA